MFLIDYYLVNLKVKHSVAVNNSFFNPSITAITCAFLVTSIHTELLLCAYSVRDPLEAHSCCLQRGNTTLGSTPSILITAAKVTIAIKPQEFVLNTPERI